MTLRDTSNTEPIKCQICGQEFINIMDAGKHLEVGCTPTAPQDSGEREWYMAKGDSGKGKLVLRPQALTPVEDSGDGVGALDGIFHEAKSRIKLTYPTKPTADYHKLYIAGVTLEGLDEYDEFIKAAIELLLLQTQIKELTLCINDYMNEDSYYQIEAKKRLEALQSNLPQKAEHD